MDELILNRLRLPIALQQQSSSLSPSSSSSSSPFSSSSSSSLSLIHLLEYEMFVRFRDSGAKKLDFYDFVVDDERRARVEAAMSLSKSTAKKIRGGLRGVDLIDFLISEARQRLRMTGSVFIEEAMEAETTTTRTTTTFIDSVDAFIADVTDARRAHQNHKIFYITDARLQAKRAVDLLFNEPAEEQRGKRWRDDRQVVLATATSSSIDAIATSIYEALKCLNPSMTIEMIHKALNECKWIRINASRVEAVPRSLALARLARLAFTQHLIESWRTHQSTISSIVFYALDGKRCRLRAVDVLAAAALRVANVNAAELVAAVTSHADDDNVHLKVEKAKGKSAFEACFKRLDANEEELEATMDEMVSRMRQRLFDADQLVAKANEKEAADEHEEGGNNVDSNSSTVHFNFLTYNLLADMMARRDYNFDDYLRFAEWQRRRRNLIDAIVSAAPQLAALQELQDTHADEFIAQLDTHGYDVHYCIKASSQRPRLGNAVVVCRRTFELLSRTSIVLGGREVPTASAEFHRFDAFPSAAHGDAAHVAAVVVVRHRQTRRRLLVASSHLSALASRRGHALRLYQASVLRVALLQLSTRFNVNDVIVAGDLNSVPFSPAYAALRFGSDGVARHPLTTMVAQTTAADNGGGGVGDSFAALLETLSCDTTRLGSVEFKSCGSMVTANDAHVVDQREALEPTLTHTTAQFAACLDYIFYYTRGLDSNNSNIIECKSAHVLDCENVKPGDDLLKSQGAPSDHLRVTASFELKAVGSTND